MIVLVITQQYGSIVFTLHSPLSTNTVLQQYRRNAFPWSGGAIPRRALMYSEAVHTLHIILYLDIYEPTTWSTQVRIFSVGSLHHAVVAGAAGAVVERNAICLNSC